MTKDTTGRRYAIERSLAPHVDAQWAEAVLLELRLQGVAGTTIASVLSEVESHVVDSGEDARSAFGDPVEYARSLELTPDPRQDPDAGPAAVAQAAAQIVGVILLLAGAFALGGGEPTAVTWGVLTSALASTLVVTALVRHADAVLRAVVTAPWRSARFGLVLVVGAATCTLVVLPAVLMRGVALEVPAPAALVVGALLLGSATAVAVRRGRREPDDLVVSPFAEPRDASHRSSWLVQIPLAVVVVLAALGVFVLGRAS